MSPVVVFLYFNPWSTDVVCSGILTLRALMSPVVVLLYFNPWSSDVACSSITVF